MDALLVIVRPEIDVISCEYLTHLTHFYCRFLRSCDRLDIAQIRLAWFELAASYQVLNFLIIHLLVDASDNLLFAVIDTESKNMSRPI